MANTRPKQLDVQLVTLLDMELAERLQNVADHFGGPRAKLVRGVLDWFLDRHERDHKPGGKGCKACNSDRHGQR